MEKTGESRTGNMGDLRGEKMMGRRETGWEKNSPFKFNEKTVKMAVLNKVKEC